MAALDSKFKITINSLVYRSIWPTLYGSLIWFPRGGCRAEETNFFAHIDRVFEPCAPITVASCIGRVKEFW